MCGLKDERELNLWVSSPEVWVKDAEPREEICELGPVWGMFRVQIEAA